MRNRLLPERDLVAIGGFIARVRSLALGALEAQHVFAWREAGDRDDHDDAMLCGLRISVVANRWGNHRLPIELKLLQPRHAIEQGRAL